MPLKRLPYKTLDSLLEANFVQEEAEETLETIRLLRPARSRGWLTKVELCLICRWKSPRAIHHIQSNYSGTIRAITKKAFKTKDEIEKVNLLIRLKGVSIPMASAILTLLHPKKYGVIDIRVWQVLYKIRLVNTKQRGAGFSVSDWGFFLMIIRHYALKNGVSARCVEYTLFRVHEMYQQGTLYSFKQ